MKLSKNVKKKTSGVLVKKGVMVKKHLCRSGSQTILLELNNNGLFLMCKENKSNLFNFKLFF